MFKLVSLSSVYFSFSFIDWTHEIFSSVEDNVIDHFRLLGAVEALAAIFKVLF